MFESRSSAIVVGIDGSDSSIAALRWALQEAVATLRPVEVVHVWQSETLTDAVLGSAHELRRGSICMLQNEVAAALAKMSERPLVRQISLAGRPGAVLLDQATDAALLVLGAHERTAAPDLIFGRIESVCVRHANCPVIVVDSQQNVVRHSDPSHSVVRAG